MLPPEEEFVVFEVVTVASMKNNVRMMLKMGMLMPMTCTTMTKLTFYKSCCRNTAKETKWDADSFQCGFSSSDLKYFWLLDLLHFSIVFLTYLLVICWVDHFTSLYHFSVAVAYFHPCCLGCGCSALKMSVTSAIWVTRQTIIISIVIILNKHHRNFVLRYHQKGI